MNRLLIGVMGLFVGVGAHAATVDCTKGQTISAVVAAQKPATGYQTIDVIGACVDNVYIGPN